jgi:hypothetical protein
MHRGVCPMKEEQHMRTSILALAMAVIAPATAPAQSPAWQTSYAAALYKAAQQQKPLAVVFGQGNDGWKQLGGGALGGEASRTLAEQYVCCYVDTATPEGQALARQFAITTPTGLVISDRRGAVQAFWHQGPLAADALAGRLAKYADPHHVPVTTETNPAPIQSSFYPPMAPFGPALQPAYYPVGPAPFTPAMGFSRGGIACRG